MRLVFSIVGVLILTVLAALGESSAQSVAGRTARTVVTFDNVGDAPGVPEGITTDGKDGLYVSLFVLDQIWHVNPATGEKKKVADVPGGDLKGDLIGIERDPTDGTILAAFKRATKVDLFTEDHPDCRDATDASTGIYRVNPQTGAVSPFVTRGTGVSLCFPDDIAIMGIVALSSRTFRGEAKRCLSPRRSILAWCSIASSDAPLMAMAVRMSLGETGGIKASSTSSPRMLVNSGLCLARPIAGSSTNTSPGCASLNSELPAAGPCWTLVLTKYPRPLGIPAAVGSMFG